MVLPQSSLEEIAGLNAALPNRELAIRNQKSNDDHRQLKTGVFPARRNVNTVATSYYFNCSVFLSA